MEPVLKELIGRNIHIITRGGLQASTNGPEQLGGQLEAFDSKWIKIRTAGGGSNYVPIDSIHRLWPM